MWLGGFSLGRIGDPMDITYLFYVDVMILANSSVLLGAVNIKLKIYTKHGEKFG